MFFGNQVTCEYWDYVWLNEGFASYLEYVIADKVSAASPQPETDCILIESTTNSKSPAASPPLAHIGLFRRKSNARRDAAGR